MYSHSEKEHHTSLLNLMQVASGGGLILNSRQCQIKDPQITSYGTIFSKEGKKPRNCRNASTSDVQQLDTLNVMQPYIPHVSLYAASRREWLKKSQIFHWDDNTYTAFQKLKTFISKAHSTP